jgi:hypothetical protein
VFENGALRRIFRPKREEVTRGRRRIHNEELPNFCSAINIIRASESN